MHLAGQEAACTYGGMRFLLYEGKGGGQVVPPLPGAVPGERTGRASKASGCRSFRPVRGARLVLLEVRAKQGAEAFIAEKEGGH